MSEIWTNILHTLGLAWWVEVITESPRCTYYFGPFASSEEANASKQGYVDDLVQEGAQGIKVAIKRCKPRKLTVSDEAPELSGRSTTPLFSR
ncbi:MULTISPECIES: DUF1816 domain-containing protein [unclassified Leptolyngbya]|uniref:DUF1816 domain-containing protein n=1 Tax=unclassified Leptolyngbya TaxID=2650499 RepID=UPI00168A1143|nr:MULTISPECIES: DUF1816 domain-containing protein [unclassified Leptolyngbya]MBD1912152.1 DUF1816 domain-containing protein [Leptolyngbya sp. FACHB-8]MBD2155043.1 DUF1816 domain-containing protein [Leptolyngbya sp. FACHB-16]